MNVKSSGKISEIVDSATTVHNSESSMIFANPIELH